MTARISLKDVAAAAGVSVSTASLALAGDARVAAATRERTVKAAQALGYVRDPLISGLASRRFRHAGKPIVVAASTDEGGTIANLNRLAGPMGMTIVPCPGHQEGLGERLARMEAAALVVNRRKWDVHGLAALPIPVVLWEDEGLTALEVDIVETCEWWSATIDAVARLRAAGFKRPVALTHEATPRHWHDDVRKAAFRATGVPLLETGAPYDDVPAFVAKHRPDAIIGLVRSLLEHLRRLRIHLPFASLILDGSPWCDGVAGWVWDYEHRSQVTLELIEQRLRYGQRPPRRIIVPPRWRDAPSLRP